jgi:phosphorylcholine metabolism protein LicD
MDIDNQYGLKECQQDLLKLMSVFDKLCNENDIAYSADSGTLLGAIRHDGFIPWDDDLDIVVNRKNYDKLMEVDLSRYGLKRVRKTFIESLCFTDSAALTTHPILDVFTTYNTTDNAFLRKWKIARIMMIHELWHHYSPIKYPRNAYAKRI